MAAAIWMTAFLTSIGAIAVTAAAVKYPPDTVAFDKPLVRAAATLLGWAGFIIALVFAIMLDGILWPMIAAIGFGAAGWAASRSRLVARAAGAVIWLAALALICDAALFQLAFINVVSL